MPHLSFPLVSVKMWLQTKAPHHRQGGPLHPLLPNTTPAQPNLASGFPHLFAHYYRLRNTRMKGLPFHRTWPKDYSLDTSMYLGGHLSFIFPKTKGLSYLKKLVFRLINNLTPPRAKDYPVLYWVYYYKR